MLLLLVGVAGVLSLQMVSVRATSYSRHATEATMVAEDKMEELMGTSSVAVVGMSPGSDQVNDLAVADVNGEYTRSWTAVAGTLDSSMLAVTVTVTWFERGTEAHSITVSTQRRF